jgi:hypothetical protein
VPDDGDPKSTTAGEEQHRHQKPHRRHHRLLSADGRKPRRTYAIYSRRRGIPRPPAAEAASGGREIPNPAAETVDRLGGSKNRSPSL